MMTYKVSPRQPRRRTQSGLASSCALLACGAVLAAVAFAGRAYYQFSSHSPADAGMSLVIMAIAVLAVVGFAVMAIVMSPPQEPPAPTRNNIRVIRHHFN